MTYEEFDEHELAEKQWIESHSAVLAASPVVVRIERWKSDRGLWWNRGGLALFARDLVIEYLPCRNIDVPDDVEILWAEDSR
jgi:hypothetical protein